MGHPPVPGQRESNQQARNIAPITGRTRPNSARRGIWRRL